MTTIDASNLQTPTDKYHQPTHKTETITPLTSHDDLSVLKQVEQAFRFCPPVLQRMLRPIADRCSSKLNKGFQSLTQHRDFEGYSSGFFANQA